MFSPGYFLFILLIYALARNKRTTLSLTNKMMLSSVAVTILLVCLTLVGSASVISAGSASSTGGCYDPSVHVCDCTGTEDSCNGVWTDGCTCGTSDTTKEGHDQVGNDNVQNEDDGPAAPSSETASSSSAITARWTIGEGRWGTVTVASGSVFDEEHDSH
jgi:hypothetical protein